MDGAELLQKLKKSTKSNKGRKIGRNKKKCEKYLARGQRMKNNSARTGRKKEQPS